MPQLHGLFRSEMLKQYLKRILDKRLVGTLCVCVVLSYGFHFIYVERVAQSQLNGMPEGQPDG